MIDWEKSETIIKILQEYYGHTTPDLIYSNLYQLTISVVLSARTTDKQVNSVTEKLFSEYPDFKSLSKAKFSDIEKLVKSTGFYKNKASNIIKLAQMIENENSGTVPDNREDLMKLPGVGRKSANVILSMGYDIPALAVDTHVMRIARRLGYTIAEDPLNIEKDLTSTIPEKLWTPAHLLFIRHGRTICTSRSPDCESCPLSDLCENAFTFK